jgi:CubicO group peptidase (beta-lactamase class C family)
MPTRFLFAWLATFGLSAALYAAAPHVSPEDDPRHLGTPEASLFWTPQQQVAGYRNWEKIFPTRKIAAGDNPLLLPAKPMDLGGVELQQEDRTLTVDEYFRQQSVAGLLVIKDGAIVYERYGLGNTEDSLWVSYSVAKSVTSMLIGAAIQDGYIASVDEKVTDYLPRLKGSPYADSTIANLLQMASGVEWNEDYADPASDVNTAVWDTLQLYRFLNEKPRKYAPGKSFNYNTAETNLAGNLLRAAIGNNLATYLGEKIWRPFGMEADANWQLVSEGEGEFGGCCINATLRDYGRIGLFALGNGRLSDGARVLPENWMAESTRPSKGSAGYGYFWWLQEGGTYQASGIFGQAIFIDPRENVVIALHSARAAASKDSDWALENALFEALTRAVSR